MDLPREPAGRGAASPGSGPSLPTPGSRRLVVAVTGASGAVYGVRLLLALSRRPELETHLVVTAGARRTLLEETDVTLDALARLASVVHRERDLGAPIASGSFLTRGMVIAPCSIKTLSAVANCYSENLVARAADVTLKERRPLVLMVRETPLHAGHLRLMAEAAAMGATIFPPVPGFGTRPSSLLELVDRTVGRVLDLLDIEAPGAPRRTGRAQVEQGPSGSLEQADGPLPYPAGSRR